MKTETNGIDREIMSLKTALDHLVLKNDDLLELASALPTIAEEIRMLRVELISTLTGRMPENYIPLATHQKLIRSMIILNGLFVVSMLVALKMISSEGILGHVMKIFGA